MKEAGGGRPDTPLNVPITPHRRMELARVPLDQVKAIKTAAGCTINDVVLTACSMALRTFLEHRDALTPGLVLKAMVPVSVRDESEQMALGNRVSMLVAELPVDEPDGLEQLEFVSAHMAAQGLRPGGGRRRPGGARRLRPADAAGPGRPAGAARALPVNTVDHQRPRPAVPAVLHGRPGAGGVPLREHDRQPGADHRRHLLRRAAGFRAHGTTADVLPDLHIIAEGIEDAFA